MGGKASRLRQLQTEIASCSLCAPALPLGPRPVVQFSRRSAVVVVGQAPGTRVHESGVPWDDDSGDHLREWLGVTRESFYDAAQFALVPMGFCYPGKASGGDAPPRPECAPTWHERIFSTMVGEPLVLLCGQYAQRYYLAAAKKTTLTETVREFQRFLPRFFPLPHPSWRSRLWMKKNPWFADQVLPALRSLVADRVGTTAPIR